MTDMNWTPETFAPHYSACTGRPMTVEQAREYLEDQARRLAANEASDRAAQEMRDAGYTMTTNGWELTTDYEARVAQNEADLAELDLDSLLADL